MAIDIDKNISTLIRTQFPEIYREEGDKFISFVEAYYEWMEQQDGTMYHTRRLSDYRDIDRTLDDFIINFKNKYLPNVQFNTATNKTLFIKNALDFYRSKGTERAVDLFFKLIYGLEARVYYPADDLFKLSDNTWIDSDYLELRPNQNNIQFVGEQIFGSVSGATAFGERLTRVKKDNQYIEVLYITDITADFRTGEKITTLGKDINYSARIDGSLTTFEITFSTSSFDIGEVVYVSDGKGKKAKAVVNGTADFVGVVDFKLLDGGWGYSDQAQIIGSEKVVEMNNIVFNDDQYFYNTDPVYVFDTIKQDLVSIKVDTAAADEVYLIPNGSPVYAYYNNDPNANVIWEGTVVYKNSDNDIMTFNYIDANYRDSNGDVILDGGFDLFSNTGITSFYTTNNEVQIDVDTSTASAIVDAQAVANIIAWDDRFTIEYTNADNLVLKDFDVLYQQEPTYGTRYCFVEIANVFSNNISGQLYANVKRDVNWPRNNQPLIRESDGAKFTINDVSNTLIGVIGVNGEITENYIFANANTYNSNTGFYSPKTDIFGLNITATFDVFEYDEVKDFRPFDSLEIIEDMPATLPDGNTFYIEDFDTLGNTDIWDTANSEILYIREGNTPDFATTTLDDFLSVADEAVSLGRLKSIVITNPGQGYSKDPFYIVFEPSMYHVERYDFYIKYRKEAELKSFRLGEKITCSIGDILAEGIITFHDPATAEIRAVRTRLSNDIADTSHLWTERDFRHNDIIIGEISGVSASIEKVDETRMRTRSGLNADIETKAFNGEGFATSLRIIDSGFGYFGKRNIGGVQQDGEVLTLISSNNPERNITAYGFLGKQGIGEGYHPNRRSFLSSDKYIQDNEFYQEYSYQVLTALPFDKYKQTLLEILHVAGSKPFGGYVGTQEENISITATAVDELWEVKQYGVFVNENIFYSNTVISLA